jgi:hypothetical protein
MVKSDGGLCSSALYAVPLNLPSAFFTWCRAAAAKIVAAQPAPVSPSQTNDAFGAVLQRCIAVTACRVDGELPRVYHDGCVAGPLPLHRPVVWHIDLRELSAVAPRTMTLLVDRRSIPLSSKHGDAPMRIVAAVSFATTQAALWTRSFLVQSRQSLGPKAAPAPTVPPPLSADSPQGLFRIVADGAGMQRIQQLLRQGAGAAIRACSKHDGGVYVPPSAPPVVQEGDVRVSCSHTLQK